MVYICDHRATCGCSRRSTVILSKIIDGEPVVQSYSWGWMASLSRDGKHRCGASLITSSHVITAAHCVKDIKLSRLSLNFGITNLSNIGQLRNITKMYIHPLYDQQMYINDLAILRLDKPVDLINSDISIICLPTTLDFNLNMTEYPPVNENLVAIGWGTTNPFIRTSSPILRQVTVQAIARTETPCLNVIHDDIVQFCAGLPQGGKDTCHGDSGGPLMSFKHGRWQLVGITSYGDICAKPDFAGVYTRLAYYNSYIQEVINSDGILNGDVKEIKAKYESYSNRGILCQNVMSLYFFYLISYFL